MLLQVVIRNIFHHGNLKDYQTKLLSLLLPMIINLIQKVSYYSTKARLEFRGSCLKQDKSTFNHGKIVNIYIFYELDKLYNKAHPTLLNCLFGAVSVTKNADIDKNRYSGYGIGFDRTSIYSFGNGFGKNVIIFGVDMSSSVHIDN